MRKSASYHTTPAIPAPPTIGDALRGLLNGETGRLDCGTLDSFILDTMVANGIAEAYNK